MRSATKISIFSMRPTCVANIADIKRQASGGWRGFAAEGDGLKKKRARRICCGKINV